MKDSAVRQVFMFVGVLLLFMGVFGALRVGINSFAYPVYPFDGVIPNNVLITSTFYPTYQRASDCTNTSPSYDQNGNIASPSPEEEKLNKKNEANCLTILATDRVRARTYDIAVSAFLIFLGTGLIVATKRIK